MAETRDMRKQIEHFIERAEDEIAQASRQLAKGINRGSGRLVTPVSKDIEQALHEVSDFAERVVKSQRRMVRDVVKAINEQTGQAADRGRTATRGITKRVATRRKAVAKRVAAKRAPAKKAAPKKAAAKRAPAKKVPAKRAPAKKAAPKKAAARS
ncbi:MAG: hypothetical protein ACLQPH_00865 [Acidimicrobiales bacterium]